MPRVVVVLLCSATALSVIGLVMVLSASSVSSYAQYGSSFLFFDRQAAYAAVGAVMLFATLRLPYRAWQKLALPLLLLTVLLLILVLHSSTGTVVGGSARWISFGPVTVQPSELAKLAALVFTATILVRKWKHLNELGHLLIPLGPVIGLVCALIYLQPDFGTTVIVGGTVMLVMFAAGVRLRYLLGGGLLLAAAGMALIKHYQRLRLLAFLHPWRDPSNTGYQLIQSLIALGSGGWLGVGLGASRQKWMYVPNAHTDFIFSILGEELGLLGELVVLALFGMLVYSGIRIAARTRDPFGRLLASGIVGWLALQTLVNLGAVTGLLPVTGVPLPLVSFGGSSLVVTLSAIGILANIGISASREGTRGDPGARRRR
jgi:cell division protein FtsW